MCKFDVNLSGSIRFIVYSYFPNMSNTNNPSQSQRSKRFRQTQKDRLKYLNHLEPHFIEELSKNICRLRRDDARAFLVHHYATRDVCALQENMSRKHTRLTESQSSRIACCQLMDTQKDSSLHKEVEDVSRKLKGFSFNDAGDNIELLETVRRAVHLMTLGFDVSPLFPEIIKASNTKNIVQKRLCYLYLARCSAMQPETGLLTVNTFRKDCHDTNPLIRGLALRTMSSMRIPSIQDYTLPMIQNGMQDPISYVRKCAVMALGKIYDKDVDHISPESPFIVRLYEMIRDSDHQVVSNVLSVLDLLLSKKGGITVNRAILVYLCNRRKDFDEWGTITLLHTISRYKPKSTKEVYEIMSALDDHLDEQSPPVVAAAGKLFLRLSEGEDNLQTQVVARLRIPFMSILKRTEDPFSALKHIQLLVKRQPNLYEREYRQFFCKEGESVHEKKLRIEILRDIASSFNIQDIVCDITEYARDPNSHDVITQVSIESLASIALRLPQHKEMILKNLILLLHTNPTIMAGKIVIAMRDMIMAYPVIKEDIIELIPKCVPLVSTTEQICSMIWIIGEISDKKRVLSLGRLSPAYMIENFILKYDDHLQPVKLALLDASIKVFCSGASEMFPLFKILMTKASKDADVIVVDRCRFLYKLLQSVPPERLGEVTKRTESREEKKNVNYSITEKFNKNTSMYSDISAGVPS
ncbi:hypothetical protein PROFUN_10828 [Planoprotostelium fungivorum]|uniref:Clathrin/coatomer adaptor adaptin-like N-terminal domain-containing protein n=1 Tax=Planoprotostelium fungivorum TaxID=1890364 RepID=A0A2P6NCQ9_9EUKA|nr:hypothetical protein PROFUN_10828 [Planoprotostelium fungivorum]